MRRPAALRADLDVIDAALREGGASRLARRPLARSAPCRRRVRVPPRLARSPSAQRRPRARGGGDLRPRHRPPRLRRAARARAAGAAACASSPRRARWSRPTFATATRPPRCCATVEMAAKLHARFGPEVIPSYVISMTAAPSDVLEVALLLKEAGLLRPRRRAACRAQHRPAVRDHRAICAVAAAIMDQLFSIPSYRRLVESRGERAGGDARLFGQQQGRRLLDVELGAVEGRTRAGGGVRAPRRGHSAVSRARRHRRTGRRSQLSRRAGAAAGQRQRPAATDRTGRGHRQQVRRSGRRPPQPGGAGGRHLGGHAPAPGRSGRRRSAVFRGDGRAVAGTRSAPTAASFTKRRASSTISARRRPSTKSASSTSAAARRPRRSTDRIEDLRAIPWVFSWGQCRQSIPGFYGFGSAVREFLARGRNKRLALLRAMYARWPFFRTLVDKLDMVLAKIDFGIASRYAGLVPDRKLRKAIFSRIEREHDDTPGGLLRHHRRQGPAGEQSVPRPQLAKPHPVHRPAQSPAGRLATAAPFGEGGQRRASPGRAPHHQRRGGGVAQQRLRTDSTASGSRTRRRPIGSSRRN